VLIKLKVGPLKTQKRKPILKALDFMVFKARHTPNQSKFV